MVMPRRRSSARRVGPGGAGVDRPRLVDDSCEVQEPLGQSGLTGVDVGEDAQVE